MIRNIEHYILPDTATIKDALIALDRNIDGILTLIIISQTGKMLGTLTDGDVRRGLIQGKQLTDSVKLIMHTSFKYISETKKEVSLIKKYKESGIELLPYLNNDGGIEKVYSLNKISSLLPIDAVIMAGGKGERLRPLTLTTPKPLLKVGDKCIIDYNVDSLIEYGIENISITINYLGEQIEEHFKGKKQQVKVNLIREPQFLGTIGSVKYIDSFVNDTVLVMNSDLFTNINFEDFYLNYLENNADISVAAIPYSVNIPYGIFELTGIEIHGIKEKPTFNYYANGGLYLVKKQLLNLIPDNVYYNATDFLELLIAKNYKVIRYPLTGYWIDIGKHEDYNKAKEIVNHLK